MKTNIETEKVKTPLGFAELKPRPDPPIGPKPDLPPWLADPYSKDKNPFRAGLYPLSQLRDSDEQTDMMIEGQIKMEHVTGQIKLKN